MGCSESTAAKGQKKGGKVSKGNNGKKAQTSKSDEDFSGVLGGNTAKSGGGKRGKKGGKAANSKNQPAYTATQSPPPLPPSNTKFSSSLRPNTRGEKNWKDNNRSIRSNTVSKKMSPNNLQNSSTLCSEGGDQSTLLGSVASQTCRGQSPQSDNNIRHSPGTDKKVQNPLSSLSRIPPELASTATPQSINMVDEPPPHLADDLEGNDSVAPPSTAPAGTVPHAMADHEMGSVLEKHGPAETTTDSLSTPSEVSAAVVTASSVSEPPANQKDVNINDSDDDFEEEPGRRCSMASNESKSAGEFGQRYVRKPNPEDAMPKQATENRANPYSRANVRRHGTEDDLWVVIRNTVYNLTEFQHIHPGGSWPLLQVGGKDATKIFEGQHGAGYLRHLAQYAVGQVPSAERM